MPDILPDLLRPGLRLVICGSAAGTVSAQRGAYYAHPQNRFWAILAETGLTLHRLAPNDFATLSDFGIGLTDITKDQFGADSTLTAHDAQRLHNTLERHRPALLAFNGKRAASLALDRPSVSLVYGRQDVPLCGVPVFVLPSTSPLAVRWWDAAPWHELAGVVAGAS
ncbi:MAG: mismatch-specific DNA-glycosylase [Alphaproteobacteria bacterium]|jgi:TDG/mug DNA glycosylase family protein